MCIFAGKAGVACNAAVAGSGAWGLSDGMCVAHFAHYRTQLANGVNFGAATSELDDYVRILALMGDEVTFKAELQNLSAELSRTYSHYIGMGGGGWDDEVDDRLGYKMGKASIRISRLLSYYEGYCWFPDSHSNYAGLLDDVSFVWGLQMGLMPKDPGAGAAHGDFSHRLQWHVIMRVITGGFSQPVGVGWNHSPLHLFTHSAVANTLAAKIWFFLFDNNSGKSNSFRQSISMKYSNPDEVNKLVSKAEFGRLGSALKDRWDKRKERQEEGGDYLHRFLYRPENKRIFELWSSAEPLKKVCNGVGVMGHLYHWRKLAGRPVQTPIWLNHQQGFLNLALPANFNFQNELIAARGNLQVPRFASIVQFFTYLCERVAYQYWEQNIQLRPLSGAPPSITTPQGNVGGAARPMNGILTDPTVALGNIANRVASSAATFNVTTFQKTSIGVIRIQPDA